MAPLTDRWAHDEFAQIDRLGLRRVLEPIDSPQGAVVRIDGTSIVNFSSNDYLGLAGDRSLIDAAKVALDAYGLSTAASRLSVGDTTVHQALEAAIAEFEQTEGALLFNSGYAANLGLIPALVGEGDVVFSDALNHASIVDGCRLSRAKIAIYPTGDVDALSNLMRQHEGRRRLLVTESVFSMDGVLAPLPDIGRLCLENEVALVLDEAHATGIFGATGRGLSEVAGIRPDLIMGTLSKGLGSFGAYVACTHSVRELLINRARPLIFSTALPASLCAASMASIERVRSDRSLRERLWKNIRHLSLGLQALGLPAQGESAIFSIVIGSADDAVAASKVLRSRGLLIKAIRPPTVAPNTSRLRISLSAAHTSEQLDALILALRDVVTLS